MQVMKQLSMKLGDMIFPTEQQTVNATTTGLEDYSDDEHDFGGESGVPEKLFAEEENLKDKLVGVVVTISEGSSYDEMFRTVQPTTVPGERVSTYSIACGDVGKLHAHLVAPMPVADEWRDMIDDLRQVESDSVVFNWECCQGCGNHCFPGRGQSFRNRRSMIQRTQQRSQPTESETMRFMGYALSRGHTVMCSDFSLKSLLYEWSEQHLGPNPFKQVGECDHQFKLEFIPSDLQQEGVPQQLQVVGELCTEKGEAVVTALSDTILYTVKPDRPKTDFYDLKVLTIVSEFAGGAGQISDQMKCSVGSGNQQKRGTAGHVVLTYKSGGQLVTSMGHWIELSRIDTSLDAVMRAAAHNFGAAEVDDFRREYNSLATDAARYECVQKRSKALVSKSMPSQMKCRTKF